MKNKKGSDDLIGDIISWDKNQVYQRHKMVESLITGSDEMTEPKGKTEV